MPRPASHGGIHPATAIDAVLRIHLIEIVDHASDGDTAVVIQGLLVQSAGE